MKLKAAKIYRDNLNRFWWISSKLLGTGGRPKVSSDDTSVFYLDLSPRNRVGRRMCFSLTAADDECIVFKSSKPKHKFTRCARAHGRPPDGIRPKSDTSDQHDTSVASSHVFVPLESETMNVSSTETNLSENEIIPLPSAVQFFLSLDSSQSTNRYETPHSVPDLPRTAGAGIRAALLLPPLVGDCAAANDCDRATRTQDQQNKYSPCLSSTGITFYISLMH